MTEQPEKTPPQENSQAEASKSQSEFRKDMGKGKTVLLVDDDLTTSTLIKNHLKECEFEVLEAIHGKDAWFKIKPGVKPCLIICDVLMPEMDGFSLFKQLRQNEETKNIPILIISSRKTMGDTFLTLGADAFIPKPLDIKEFLKTVQVLAERGHEAVNQTPAKESPAPGSDEEKKI